MPWIHPRSRSILLALLVVACTPFALAKEAADPAAAALDTAVERGEGLWKREWSESDDGECRCCSHCHGPASTRMSAARLASYPKYDETAGRVITGQEKLVQMIRVKLGGEAPALGSEDLTALEAFIGTLPDGGRPYAQPKPPSPRARIATRSALERGKRLWQEPLAEGGRACVTCHEAGAQALTKTRLGAYPKVDPESGEVLSLQVRLQREIRAHGGAEPPALGSDDLNALEAYLTALP